MGFEGMPTNNNSKETNQLEMEKGAMDEKIRNEEDLSVNLEGQLKETEEALSNFQEQHKGEAYSSTSDNELNKLHEKVVSIKQDMENCQSRLLNSKKARAALGA